MNVRRRTPGLFAAAFLLVAMIASSAGSVAFAAQTADDTATFHGNAARTGEQPGPAPEGDPTVAWQFQTGAAVRSSPVIADGILYIGSNDGFLYALDAVTGAEQWRFETGGRITGAAAVADGSAYVGSADGYVYAIDVASGSQQWRFFAAELNAGVSRFREQDRQRGMLTSSPVVVDDLVIVTSNSFKVTAIDTATGIEQWHTIAGESDVTTPTVADGVLYYASPDGVDALEAATGARLWRASFIADQGVDEPVSETDGDEDGSDDPEATEPSDEPEPTAGSTGAASGGDTAGSLTAPENPLQNGEVPLVDFIEASFPELDAWDISAAPVAANGEIFLVIFGTTASDAASSGSSDASEDDGPELLTTDLLSLNPENGNVTGIGYFYAFKSILATPAVVDGVAYIGVDQGLLYAYDVEEGGEVWGVQTESTIASSPVVAEETIFFGNDDGFIFALATETGVEQWRFETGGSVRSSPVVENGLVYAGSDDGTVYAIGGS
ncbi:MAG: PQQ-binding-like beta-propeller repeat protein [Thermomicrobiales bacterium]